MLSILWSSNDDPQYFGAGVEQNLGSSRETVSCDDSPMTRALLREVGSRLRGYRGILDL
jgi:hypothetical protein